MSAPGTPCPLTPSSSNNQSGLVFANLTVAYSTQASPAPPPCSNTSLCGKAPSVWSFPNIGGLIIQDVDVVNGDNCIDAGFANFVKVQGPGDGPPGGSTTEFQCSGDFFAAHGGEGTILIDKVSWKGGRGTGVGNGGLGQGIFMDFTDLNASRYLATANTTITTITSSDLEGAAWGFLDFADANTLATRRIGRCPTSGRSCGSLGHDLRWLHVFLPCVLLGSELHRRCRGFATSFS